MLTWPVFVHALLLLFLQRGSAQDGLFLKPGSEYPFYIYTSGDSIRSWDAGSKKVTTIAECPSMHELSISSQGLIGFSQTVPGKIDPGGNSGTQLVVMKLDGHVLRTLEPERTIRSLVWSPDGSKVAFVTGLADEKLYDTYEKAETFIYDVSQGKVCKIFHGGARVYWAAFDGNLYIYDRRSDPVVHCYVPITEKIQATEYKDIHFSPDGKHYYIRPRDVSEGLPLYVSKTNDAVASLTVSNVSPIALARLEPRQWFDNDWIICIIQTGSSDFYGLPMYLLNVRSGEIRKAHHHIVSPYTADSVVLRLSSESLLLEKISEMSVVSPEDLPLPG